MRLGYAKVPVSVVLNGEIPPRLKTLYAVIAAHLWGESETAWPSQRRVADCCGIKDERTIRTWTRELEDLGLLTTERERPDGPLCYSLWVIPGGRTQESGGGRTQESGEVKEVRTEEKEVTTRVSSEEDLKLINEFPGKATTKWGRRLQTKLRQYSGRSLDLVTTYLEIAEDDPRGKAKSDQGKCSRLDELRDLEDEFGTDAWLYGLQECRRIGKAGTAYVKRIMEGYDPEQHEKQVKASAPSTSDDEWIRQKLLKQGRRAQGFDVDDEGADE